MYHLLHLPFGFVHNSLTNHFCIETAIGTATCKQHGPLQMDDTHNIVRCDFFMAQEIGAAVIGLVCGNSKGCSTTGNP